MQSSSGTSLPPWGNYPQSNPNASMQAYTSYMNDQNYQNDNNSRLHAQRLLYENGIDIRTLSVQQFDIFVQQPSRLQKKSIKLFQQYSPGSLMVQPYMGPRNGQQNGQEDRIQSNSSSGFLASTPVSSNVSFSDPAYTPSHVASTPSSTGPYDGISQATFENTNSQEEGSQYPLGRFGDWDYYAAPQPTETDFHSSTSGTGVFNSLTEPMAPPPAGTEVISKRTSKPKRAYNRRQPGEFAAAQSIKRPRVKTGCTTCRNRRLKCDEGKPTCGNCRKSNRECVYGGEILSRDKKNPGKVARNRESSESFTDSLPLQYQQTAFPEVSYQNAQGLITTGTETYPDNSFGMDMFSQPGQAVPPQLSYPNLQESSLIETDDETTNYHHHDSSENDEPLISIGTVEHTLLMKALSAALADD